MYEIQSALTAATEITAIAGHHRNRSTRHLEAAHETGCLHTAHQWLLIRRIHG
jgi:hypothetical protein